ncbi:glycosyltransferase [Janibacter alittae]|uniref:D-inositol 3-phosphate glycosyltransferase n=1 Tax=Janibacter alittae TaxID=3115209 RepID=A0ABZ2MGJ2_9MICO
MSALADTVPRGQIPREHDRVVVMSGRISDQKDPGFFASTAKEVWRRDPTVRFRWIGGEVDSNHTRRLRGAGVEITGWLAPLELADALAHAGVYLHSAIYEGFPISLLDALWCRVPAVVRPIPALSDTGLPSAPTPRAAADLVLAVLDDETQRANAVRAGEELLAGMTTDSQRQAIARIYG